MLRMRRKLSCCSRDTKISIDLDEQQRIMTYEGLESCIQNSQACYNDNESSSSRGDHGCGSDSIGYDDDYSTCSSSKEVSGSVSSKWFASKSDKHSLDNSEAVSSSPKHYHVKEKPNYALKYSDVEIMKEKFSRLLLGEDVTGGRKGISSALALSNAITHLAVSVFGEMWKLEPLGKEKKQKWSCEMDWLLSPANYMIELVPAKQCGANGRTLEIMTPKAREDISMNLPALQKLDSMLIAVLDSMVHTEFWYNEVGSRAEGRTKSGNESKRWWLPLPQVPKEGLTDSGRKKLRHQSKVVYQVFKAAKSINESILLQMAVPSFISETLPKSGRENLGEELFKALIAETSTAEKMLNSLSLKSDHTALEAINRLESAIFVWKEKITTQVSRKSPVKTPWSFTKDPCSQYDKKRSILDRAEALQHLLKTRYPNLPPSFLDTTKIQNCKDVGHSTLEAYSRVLGKVASSILSRIADVLQEDALRNPDSIAETSCFSTPGKEILTRNVNGPYSKSDPCNNADLGCPPSEAKVSSSSVTTPSRRLVSALVERLLV